MEHPFGVIKRQWDFYYIMTKRSIQHASVDVGMIFTAYHLRRILNILDKNLLNAYLMALGPLCRPLSSPLRPFLVLDFVAIWCREFSCLFVLGCCNTIKMGNLDWELRLKWSC